MGFLARPALVACMPMCFIAPCMHENIFIYFILFPFPVFLFCEIFQTSCRTTRFHTRIARKIYFIAFGKWCKCYTLALCCEINLVSPAKVLYECKVIGHRSGLQWFLSSCIVCNGSRWFVLLSAHESRWSYCPCVFDVPVCERGSKA